MSDSAETSAIEMLYRRYAAALVLFAAAIVGERSRAQDAVHQVFLRLLERGGLDRAADAKAYLFASVRNVILNDLRARERNVSIHATTGQRIAGPCAVFQRSSRQRCLPAPAAKTSSRLAQCPGSTQQGGH